MFQQSDSESNNNTKEPEDVAELELVSYLREKPVLVKLDSEEDNTDPLGLLYSADWTHGLDSRTGLADWIHVDVQTRRRL